MRRAPLPLWRPPYRADLYEIWLQVMALPPSGDTRAQALYLKARDLAALTKEPLPKLVWALATFQRVFSNYPESASRCSIKRWVKPKSA